ASPPARASPPSADSRQRRGHQQQRQPDRGRSEHMNPAPQAKARPAGRRFDPKYTPFLVPAIMAIAMSFVMSLVQTIARLGFAPNLASAWLTSFAIGAAVAIPTAILVGPSAPRLAGHLTGPPRHSAPCPRH